MIRLTKFRGFIWLGIALLGLIALPVGLAMGNPSSSHPERQLALHGTVPEARALAAKLYGVFEKLQTGAIEMNLRKDNPARFSYRKIESSTRELVKAQRDAKHLRLMGEPAGVDLTALIDMLRLEFHQLAQLFRVTTPGSAQVQKNIAELKRQHPRNQKALDKIASSIKNNQLEVAEKQLEKMQQEMEALACILIPSQASRYMNRMRGLVGELDAKLDPARRKQYFDEAKKVAAKNMQEVSDFVAEATRVRTEIAAQGKVSVEGSDDLTAPAAIRYLAKRWGGASAALTRNLAIQWAFVSGNAGQVRERSMPQVSQLKSTATEAIIAVIDAAAVSTPAEEIPAAYSQILESLSYVDRRMSGSGISKDSQAALQRFAAKSPKLTASIAAYDRAVSQPLSWRSRFATRHGAAVKSGYSAVSSLIAQKYDISRFAKPEMYAPHRPAKRELVTPTFTAGAGWRVADASQFVVGARVADEKILRLYEGSLTAISPLAGMYYCNVAIGMPVEKALDDLRISLIVNDDYPPLNIEAADAISAGESQDFLEFGGTVKQLHLEALVTRLATLPGRAHQLVPLGTLPSLHKNGSPIDQACWRMDVEPHWVRHRYFTVAIPGKLPK